MATPAADGTAIDAGRVPSVVVGTAYGPVRAVVAGEISTWERAGIGIPSTPALLPESWASSPIALRISSAREPVVDASDLGALLPLAAAADGTLKEIPDVVALSHLIAAHPDAEVFLEAIATTDSLRAAAGKIGLHHSTVQARAGQYSDALGFDLRSPRGRVRLALALSVRRLGTTRFSS